MRQHNRIQFLGYEVANVMLAVHAARGTGHAPVSPTVEFAAALALLTGSACIWRFDPRYRPSMLYTGGMALTLGGFLLVAAGYAITGIAVALASLETARGGLSMLQAEVAARRAAHRPLERSTRAVHAFASLTLGPYVALIERIVRGRERLGRLINDRPFLTSALIKAPLRVGVHREKGTRG